MKGLSPLRRIVTAYQIAAVMAILAVTLCHLLTTVEGLLFLQTTQRLPYFCRNQFSLSFDIHQLYHPKRLLTQMFYSTISRTLGNDLGLIIPTTNFEAFGKCSYLLEQLFKGQLFKNYNCNFENRISSYKLLSFQLLTTVAHVPIPSQRFLRAIMRLDLKYSFYYSLVLIVY